MGWLVDTIDDFHISILVRVACVIHYWTADVQGLEDPSGSGAASEACHIFSLTFATLLVA